MDHSPFIIEIELGERVVGSHFDLIGLIPGNETDWMIENFWFIERLEGPYCDSTL